MSGNIFEEAQTYIFQTFPQLEYQTIMEGYQVIRPLASGSFGQIFVVKEEATGSTAVLKKISVATLDEKERDSV